MPNSIVDNNELDILSYGNEGYRKSGSPSSLAGGLGSEASFPVTRITGSVVCYDNAAYDVNIGQATNCDLTVYRPEPENTTTINSGASSNLMTIIDFNCSDQLIEWCQEEYCSEILGLNDYDLNNNFKIFQNYTNPVRAFGNIEYKISNQSFVSLKVYDIAGREVVTLINENKFPGNHDFQFNRRKLSGGTYFFRIRAGDFVETKKIVFH